MKRKGGEVAAVPCSVVKSLAASIGEMAISNLPTDSSSSRMMLHESSSNSEKTSWDVTLKSLRMFLSTQEAAANTASSLITEALGLVSKIEQESKEKPLKDFTAAQSKLAAKIQQEKKIYQSENADLAEIESSIQKKQIEIESLRNVQGDLLKEKKRLEKQIEEYKIECAEEIEVLDSIETQMIQQIPRVKKRISLYSQATGIKWNYDNIHMVEGELVSRIYRWFLKSH